MSGTIVVSSSQSVDVRTVDFLRIVDALRKQKDVSETAGRLLEDVDVFGMNMICADELSAKELAEFGKLLEGLAHDSDDDKSGFRDFLGQLCGLISSDKRMT